MAPRGHDQEQDLHGVDPRRVLKVDVDIPNRLYDYDQLFRMRLRALELLGYEIERAWYEPSPSGEHLHYVVVLKRPLPSMKDVYDLQVFLGDDHKRATFNYVRFIQVGESSYHFNVLFRKKIRLTRRMKLQLAFSIMRRAMLRHCSRVSHSLHVLSEGTKTLYTKPLKVMVTRLPSRKYSSTTRINKNEKR